MVSLNWEKNLTSLPSIMLLETSLFWFVRYWDWLNWFKSDNITVMFLLGSPTNVHIIYECKCIKYWLIFENLVLLIHNLISSSYQFYYLTTMDQLLRPKVFETSTTDPSAEKLYKHWKMTFNNYIEASVPAVPVATPAWRRSQHSCSCSCTRRS